MPAWQRYVHSSLSFVLEVYRAQAGRPFADIGILQLILDLSWAGVARVFLVIKLNSMHGYYLIENKIEQWTQRSD
jgi:hypothetical protein